MDWLDIKEFIKDSIKFIIFIVIVLLLAIYVIGLQQVVGPSMSPTYKDADINIISKINYRIFDIKRNDVIVFNNDNEKNLIKRVIGLPNEYIEYKNNTLYINGINSEENFLNDDVITEDFSLKDIGYDKIPENMYFVIGDNRTNSKDSREIGLIKKEDIIGKVLFRIWPLF